MSNRPTERHNGSFFYFFALNFSSLAQFFKIESAQALKIIRADFPDQKPKPKKKCALKKNCSAQKKSVSVCLYAHEVNTELF